MRRMPVRRGWAGLLVLLWVLVAVVPHALPVLVGVVVVVALGVGAVRSGLLGARPGLPRLGLGRRAPQLTEAQADEQERSRRRIERGGIPVSAERRLSELRAGGSSLWTSDLSVDEHALLHREGIVPLTQVMGSSIFQHGWQNLPYGQRGWAWGGRGFVEELTSISDAFNGARERALSRLLEEARLAGADAVVAVRLDSGGHDWAGAGTVELTAIGTAVRLPEALRTGDCVITDLSGQEHVKLARAGYRPVGVVGHTAVTYVAASDAENRIVVSGNSLFSMAGRQNVELGDFTRGFYDTREIAMLAVSRDAQRLGADGIVGVTFAEDLREREYEDSSKRQRKDLIVYVHVLGTAIRAAPVAPAPEPAPLTILPLRRPRAAA